MTASSISPAARLEARALSTRRLPLLAVSITWSTRSVESTVLLRGPPELKPWCGLMLATPRLSTGLGRCEAIWMSAWLASSLRRAAMMSRLQRTASRRTCARVSAALAGGATHGPSAGSGALGGTSEPATATPARALSRLVSKKRGKENDTINQARFDFSVR